jgi:hypothetical protein
LNQSEFLLAHYDRIVGSEARYVTVSDPGVRPVMNVAIYSDFPESGSLAGFTVGLSLFHPPNGDHKELFTCMHDDDDKWLLACGFIAYQLREVCPFTCGDTINFKTQISRSSEMSAFLIAHPLHIGSNDTVIETETTKIELIQLVPIYDHERVWLKTGDPQSLLGAYTKTELLNPRRAPYAL